MRTATHVDYNSRSRQIEARVLIHLLNPPVECLSTNYLVDTYLLEEMHSDDGDTPLGKITSNEIDINLNNPGQIFTPTNESSPYFGHIHRGVKIEYFLRPKTVDNSIEWDPMGVFYVNSWETEITDTTVHIVGYDSLYDIINGTKDINRVLRNVTYEYWVQQHLALYNKTAEVVGNLAEVVPFAYPGGQSGTLQNILIGAGADCYCSHNGNIQLAQITKKKIECVDITETDQIIKPTVTQAINTGFEAVEVTAHITHESNIQSLLQTDYMVLVPGVNALTLTLSTTPMVRFVGVATVSHQQVRITEVQSTVQQISFIATNATTESIQVKFNILGTTIDTYKYKPLIEATRVLRVDSLYSETFLAQDALRTLLQRYANSKLPILTIEVRGDPTLQLGTLITAHSEKYSLTFTGILIRATYSYNGSLSSTITLLDATIMEVL